MPDPSAVARPWCNAYPPGVPDAYDYPVVPVTRFVDDAARDFPTRDALRLGRRTWTWSDVRDLVDRSAAMLAELGVGAGDRVALVTPTTPAAVVVGFAVWRLGAVLVPLDPSLPVEQLTERLVDVAPSVVVTDVAALDGIGVARAHLPGLRHVVATDPVRWLQGRERWVAPLRGVLTGRRTVQRDDDVLLLDDLLDDGPALVRQVATEPDTPAAILFTGGTTGSGRGRGVVLTHGNLVANAFQTRLWVPDVRSGREVILGALPLWHVYGLTSVLLTGALAGAAIVLVPRPDPDALLAAIDTHRPTLFPGIPRMFRTLAAHPGAADHDLSSLRVAVTGGAPLQPDTIRAFEAVAHGVRVRQGYGQTETGPLTHASPVYGPVVEDAVGLPVTDTIAIVRRLDDAEERADVGEVGELLVAGPQVMAGYWRGPDTALEAVGPWFATGDLATVDADGVFRVLGRRTDLVVRDGVRIVPARVEEVFERHPSVERAVVVGIERGRDTEVVAVLVPRTGRACDPDAVLHEVAGRISSELVPDRAIVRRSLPESVLGKVLRRTLRAELAAALEDADDHGVHPASTDGVGATTEEVGR